MSLDERGGLFILSATNATIYFRNDERFLSMDTSDKGSDAVIGAFNFRQKERCYGFPFSHRTTKSDWAGGWQVAQVTAPCMDSQYRNVWQHWQPSGLDCASNARRLLSKFSRIHRQPPLYSMHSQKDSPPVDSLTLKQSVTVAGPRI